MPPKKISGGGERNKDVHETEDPLQAVVLADSFETHFHPFTLERPRCLLPLANTPLIEYTLEYLASVGIEEVFVYCSAHADQITEYLKSSKWTTPHAPFRIHTLRSTSRSIGDAMRDLDKRAILANDFLVIYGDVVANVPLAPALAAHRARRATDKNAIMTMILREAGSIHRAKANDSLPTFVIDPLKQRCIYYQQIALESEGLLLDQDALQQDVEVRADLIDCGIDICTPDVLALWSDNFDYEKPRAGFLHSVLKDYELNGKTIHTHVVNDCYAARVRNLHAYDAVSKDVIGGWSWPFVPCTNWAPGMKFRERKSQTTLGEGSKVSNKAHIGSHTTIGANTTIGASTLIQDSVIGYGCTIGKACKLDAAYIWDNVTLQDNSIVQNAIIASDASIGARSRVDQGALVSYGVKLPQDSILGKRKRAVHHSKLPEGTTTVDTSSGYSLLVASSGEDNDSTALTDAFYDLHMNESQDSMSTLESEVLDDDEDVSQHRPSITSVGSEDSHIDRGADSFVSLNASSIYDSLQHGHDVSTIQLELQSQRMAANASEQQVRHSVVTGLCRWLSDTQKQGKQVHQIVHSMKSVFERTVFDSNDKEKVDQVDYLTLLQMDATKRLNGVEMFSSMCNGLYLIEDWDQEGVFQAEAFEQWWESAEAQKTAELTRVREKMRKFIDLVTAESDEDESDSDE